MLGVTATTYIEASFLSLPLLRELFDLLARSHSDPQFHGPSPRLRFSSGVNSVSPLPYISDPNGLWPHRMAVEFDEEVTDLEWVLGAAAQPERRKDKR